MRGKVKWFNPQKGYGFIKQEDGPDVFVHYTDIMTEGFKHLEEGQLVEFDIIENPKGRQEEDQLVDYDIIEIPKGLQAKNVANLYSDQEEPESDMETVQQELVALALVGNKIKLVALTPDGKYKYLDETQNLHEILYIGISQTHELELAVEELEEMINDPKTREKDLQEFFEKNPDFILNDEYKKAHPHIVLARDDDKVLIPDFILEPIEQSELCDLLELKLPSAQVYVLKKNRMRYSAAVYEACAQLRAYRDFFEDERNQQLIYSKYSFSAFRPKMFVVIGRRGDIDSKKARKIESEGPDIHLRTYDEIIARMKEKIKSMQRGRRI